MKGPASSSSAYDSDDRRRIDLNDGLELSL